MYYKENFLAFTMWTWDFLFYSMDNKVHYHYSCWCSNYPRFDQWEPLQASSCILFIHPYNKLFQAHCISLGPAWNQPFSKELWFLFLYSLLSYCGGGGRAASTRRRDFHIGRGTVTSLPGYSLLHWPPNPMAAFAPSMRGKPCGPYLRPSVCIPFFSIHTLHGKHSLNIHSEREQWLRVLLLL